MENWCNACEKIPLFDLEVLDLNSVFHEGGTAGEKASALALLEKIHRGLYTATFPIPAEQESLKNWIIRLERGKTPLENQLFHIMGKGLNHPEKAEIVCFVVNAFYPQSQTGLVNYVIRDKAYRRDNPQGNPYYPAKPFLDYSTRYLERYACTAFQAELRAIFWESNNPARVHYTPGAEGSEDCMDPARRIHIIMENFGYRRINMDYFQGDIGNGECENLILYLCRDHNNTLKGAPEDLKRFLVEFNAIFNEGRSLQTPAGKQMMAQVEEMLRGERKMLV